MVAEKVTVYNIFYFGEIVFNITFCHKKEIPRWNEYGLCTHLQSSGVVFLKTRNYTHRFCTLFTDHLCRFRMPNCRLLQTMQSRFFPFGFWPG